MNEKFNLASVLVPIGMILLQSDGNICPCYILC
jgi:hypothetical protein